MLTGSKRFFDEEKVRRLNEEEFDRASNLQSRENRGFIRGWNSYLSRTDEISVPTLVIHGTDDPIIPYEHGVHLSKIISNAVLITLDGAGDELHYND
ncbi:alpha/beta fold hydrolase [Clostridium beijerinckii]|uniref:alpha/beta fold hydrolase n=1 Tax=Clostridium beijerinckii TaxID=1520 RepID=UPI003242BB30